MAASGPPSLVPPPLGMVAPRANPSSIVILQNGQGSSPSQPPSATTVPLLKLPGTVDSANGSNEAPKAEPLTRSTSPALAESPSCPPSSVKTPLGMQPVVRVNGLGYFHKLTDKMIIRILLILTNTKSWDRNVPTGCLWQTQGPRVLAPLLQVSRAMHQFAAWEYLWKKMVENLTLGNFDYEISWRCTMQKTLQRLRWESQSCQSGVMGEKPTPLTLTRPSHFEGFYSHYMYTRWYRTLLDLSRFECETGHIGRFTGISPEEHNLRFDAPRNPCIYSDVIPRWKAMWEWSPDKLIQRFGDRLVKIAQYSQTRGRMLMTIKQYWTYCRQQLDEKPLYVFDNAFQKRIPELLDEYQVPQYAWLDFFSLLGRRRPDYRWIVMGPARSGTAFHIDPNGTSAWNALLHGRKRWAFYPPHIDPPGVEVTRDKAGNVTDYEAMEPNKWYCEVFPSLPMHLRPIEVIQRAGDLLYVPAGWFHMVYNLDETVSVTQNFVTENNITLSTQVLFRRGEHDLLRYWTSRLRDVRPDMYKKVIKKIKMLEGKKAKDDLKRLKEKYISVRNSLRRRVRELKSTVRDYAKKNNEQVSLSSDESSASCTCSCGSESSCSCCHECSTCASSSSSKTKVVSRSHSDSSHSDSTSSGERNHRVLLANLNKIQGPTVNDHGDNAASSDDDTSNDEDSDASSSSTSSAY